jgi:exonuclease SbcC
MIPTRLSLANFMCYRAASDVEAPTLCFEGLHVVCLSGENGAGKSALLDAITWALWGEARVADDDLISQGASEMFVDLEFCLGPQRYRVRRARQRGGVGKRGGQTPGKSQLDLFAHDGERWRPIGENGVRETQQQINALLHMSYQTFINASFLLQGRADEFTARTPAERKQVLADILDLGAYATLEARARERARTLDDQLKGLQGRIGHLSQQADQVPFWEEQVRAAEDHATQVEVRYAQTRDEHTAAAERLRLLETRAERRKEVRRLLAERRADLTRREQDLAELRTRIAATEALLARRDAIHAGMQALAAARAEVERLDVLRDRYEELSRRQADLRQQFAEEKARLREGLRAAQARHEDLARRAARRETLLAELDTLATTLDALAPVAAERAQRAAEIEGVAQRIARIEDLLRRRESLTATLQARREALQNTCDARSAELKRLEAQLEQAERWRADLAAARADQSALAEAEERLVTLRAAEQNALERLSALRAAARTARNESEKLERNRSLLDEGAGICPVCGTTLGADGIARARRHYEAELDRLREAEAAARRDARQVETQLDATRGAIAELETAMTGLRGSAARVESLERQLEAVPAWRAEADTRRAELDELRVRLDTDTVDLPTQAELASIATDLDLLGDPQELAQTLRMLDERLAELDRRLHNRGQLEGRQEAYREELRRIEADLGDLPALSAEIAELQRVIDTNDFAHALRDEGLAVRAAIEALGYDAEAHAAAREQARDLRHWEDEERALAVAQEGLNRDRTILLQNEELRAHDAAEVERLTREDALLEQELRELPGAQARLAELQQALSAADHELQAARRDHAEKSSYMRQARVAAAELEQARSEERALQERYGLFAELAEAFGKKGVQAMLIETAIPQIEDEANRLLGRMTDNQMHVSFEMQRDTKKGDTVETLEIRIADALGTRVYDAFSGGEAMRANFAIRIALSRLLARRAGARLETLVIDEGFGVLDAVGRERMVEAITSVQEDFKRIIVITHIDDLKDRFPAQIEVTRTPLGSRWEIR